ncbi:Rne/Rng family ribonuclease [Corynebacterium falsenii]|uniref:Rne/Rng family ribonuclease n=1 Tax=Corynebacterium falsenii TaxID=108486 RepID=UPI00046D16B6|nr:Rne/Rng family ribonuclease [Corynebacterium falsenii]UBI05527.1 Rne/Rng family ribonuclease [Corynebacterium falsenii]
MATISPETAAAAAQFDKSTLGEKVRVHTIAKQLGVRASDFLGVLEDHGIAGKKTASTLTRSQVEGLLDAIAGGNASGSASESTSAKKTAAKKAPAKKTQAKKTTAKRAPAKKAQAKKSSAKAAEKESAQEGSEKKAPANKAQAADASDASNAPKESTGSKGSKGSRGSKTSKSTQGEKKSTKAQKSKSESNSESKNADQSQDNVELAIQQDAPAQTRSDNAPAENTPAENTAAESAAAGEQGNKPSSSSRRRVRRRVVRRVTSPAAAKHSDSEKAANAANSDKAEKPAKTDQAEDSTERTEATERKHKGRKNQNGAQNTSERKPAEKKPKPEQLHPAEREDADVADEPVRLKGSTRLESQRRWRAENRDKNFKAITRSEFLARRESVERTMVVRDSHRSDHEGLTTQVGVVEDGMLVEHFVTSETQQSIVGNIYLGRVQNVLSSMEAAFIDIGTGRNAVLYAGEMNWHSPHLHTKSRRIESALKAGDQIMVQVIKDPLGHKGARLTNRISFAGRYLVYFPGGTTAGISRKLPEPERKRLKDILADVIPGEGGAIIRTAAESVSEEQIAADVERLHKQWEHIEKEEQQARERKGSKPITLYEEPNMLVKVVRDLFNEDFSELVVEGAKSWKIVRDYVGRMAPELKDRVVKWDPRQHDDEDVFAAKGLDEQLAKALSRKVWLPSGGYLIIDRTEAMTVIDVNTGSFIGSGGNLEETVTQNNLEAAEEIVRQMRLRDLGGMIVVDFIDMVLEENQDLVLRRLTEYLGRDRTRHKVSEVTSLGLVQMTRKRLGTGLLETFATTCEACDGRGVIIHADPVEHTDESEPRRDHGHRKERQQARRQRDAQDASRRTSGSHGSHGSDESHGSEKSSEKSEDSRDNSQGQSRRRSSSRRHNDQHTDVAKIASDALRTAAKEDPDEPSGSDYVADEAAESPSHEQRGTRRRRRVVNRVVRSGVDAKGDDRKKTEKAEKKAEPKQEKRQERQADAQTSNESSAARKRRVRRVVRKRTTATTATTSQRTTGQRSAGSAQRAAVKGSQQSREEFENSPRRKRATRGNSRSDVPPQDQGDQAPQRQRGNKAAQASGAKQGSRDNRGNRDSQDNRSNRNGRGGSRSRGRRVVRSRHDR